MKQRNQSRCPISYGLDLFGDRWTLLVLRDILIHGKRRYREFLASDERIATNILADRLKSMVDLGLIERAEDPEHGAQAVYTPTAKGQALKPVLMAIALWSLAYGPDRLAAP